MVAIFSCSCRLIASCKFSPETIVVEDPLSCRGAYLYARLSRIVVERPYIQFRIYPCAYGKLRMWPEGKGSMGKVPRVSDDRHMRVESVAQCPKGKAMLHEEKVNNTRNAQKTKRSGGMFYEEKVNNTGNAQTEKRNGEVQNVEKENNTRNAQKGKLIGVTL